MNRYLDDYLDARLSIAEIGWSRLPNLGKLRPLARLRAWQESQRAFSDLTRLDGHQRADIGLAPDGLHPLAEDCAAAPAEANDNRAPLAA